MTAIAGIEPDRQIVRRGHGGQIPAGRVAMFVPNLSAGGAEQVILTLAQGCLDNGHAVDIVVVKAEGTLLSRVPRDVRLIELGTRRVVNSVPALARYLRRERPSVLLSTLNTANAVAVLAKLVAREPVRVVIRQAVHLTRNFEDSSVAVAVLDRLIVRWVYPWADAVIAVSAGVANDLGRWSSMRRTPIHVVPNPIVTAELRRLAKVPLDHPWFACGAPPVVLGAGRLTPQKGFDVLIRAFARVCQSHNARLVILGEGEERLRLQALVRELGLDEVVSLPGFTDNPFAYMSRARVFALSSVFEGLPGALIQALACEVAVVATDCDSGPREILQHGRLGRLVPVGDVAALADAIGAALCEPRRPFATDSCLQYEESSAVDAYLRVLRGGLDG